MWDLSCRDWEARLADGRSLVPDLPFLNRAEADRAVAVFNALRLPDVPGQPTLGEAFSEPVRDFVRAIFGSVVDGVRMIREFLDLEPKKNAKTTKGAGIMVTAALLTRRPRAEYLLIGPTQLIADTAFNQALGMLLADPELMERFHVQQHIKKITVRATGVSVQVKTFDEQIVTGVKVSGGALIDEIHLLGELAKADAVMRQIEGGMLPYPEAFLIGITTQSEKPPAGVFKQKLDLARDIRDGRAKGRMLPVLYELPRRLVVSNEWRDPKYWHWVNPNMGRSFTREDLIEMYEGAVAKGEAALRGWASQHLNLEIGTSLGQWEGAYHWAKNADETLRSFDELLDRSDVVVFGYDGGGLDDLGALCAMGRDRVTRKKLVWVHAWAFKGTKGDDGVYRGGLLERRKEIVPALEDFAAEGTLTWFEALGDDIEQAVEYIVTAEEAGLLPDKGAVGVDPSGVMEFIDALALKGITVESGRVVGILQGWTLTNIIKQSARWLAAGTLLHGGTALMNWVMGNIKVEPRGNALSVTKQTAGSAKIDPFLAMLDAGSLMARNPEAGGVSVYAAPVDTEEVLRPADAASRYQLARDNYARRFLGGDD